VTASAHMYAATAEAAPPELPPTVYLWLYTLRVCPLAGLRVDHEAANSGTLVHPKIRPCLSLMSSVRWESRTGVYPLRTPTPHPEG